VATKKLYFKIGEACKKLDIQPYVLRYWETEFPALSPDKSKSGQRVYSSKDLQVIARIKELLYEEGFTIAGAKKKLEGELKTGLKPLPEGGEAAPPAEAAPEEAADTEEAAAAAPADDTTAQELAAMRKGVEKALKEARGILDSLDSGSKSG
jgi:DNA-binding transcriptional MerR regulator